MQRRPLTLFGASLAAVACGVVWYLEPVFGGLRMDELGIARAGAVMPSPLFLLLKLILAGLGAYLMAQLLGRVGVRGPAAGARLGAVLGLFSLTASFDSAQAGQPLVLIVTDGMFFIVMASVMGAILASTPGHERGVER